MLKFANFCFVFGMLSNILHTLMSMQGGFEHFTFV